MRLAAAVDSGTYRVSVTGVVNLRRLTGGGDTSFVAEAEPASADSAAVADTTGAASDPAAAPPDTAGAPPDTVGAPPDTARRRV